MMTIVVGEIAHDPHAGMIHFYDGGDALSGAEPEAGHADWLGERIAVHGDDREDVAGQRETADLSGAAVEDVEQRTLARFHADGFAVTEHAAVDGKGVVAHLVAVRIAFG